MPEEINVDFRPKTYFRPQKLERYLISQVKGAVVRDRLERLLAEGRHDELQNIFGDEVRKAPHTRRDGGLLLECVVSDRSPRNEFRNERRSRAWFLRRKIRFL